ncbi:MAG: protein translocase subunit SecD [Candidatus Levybacteria bacterium]|nr:protein translocase subunit SecD [Candidatus Levybacteria bacterium]
MDSQVLIKYFWVVLAIAVFLILYYKIDSFKSPDKDVFVDFKADFYAKDVALLLNRMISSDNSITVNYELDKDYDVELKENNVIVRYKGIEQAKQSLVGDTSNISLKKTDLGGKDLRNTSVVFDPNTGSPQVQLVFTSEGSKKFADITERNLNKVLAIVLDGEILSTPVVNQKIVGGDAVIEGGFTTETAQALSTQLNAGALPVPLVLLEEHTVGPTLGRDALQKSIFAGIIGFISIIFFMSALYGKNGLVANLALFLYVILTLAIFKLSNLTPYGITLTLSGIAGFVLSVGMAVDANILIFERMKEEVRLGKSPQTVVELGFTRAWSSIRDSNISTLITSLILYQFGTGAVRGFALVLAIGVMVSMFSAIVVTRTFLRFLYGHNR